MLKKIKFNMSQALILLILAQVWLSKSRFVFELEVDLDSVTAGDFSCEIGTTDNDPQCRLYFEVFCLREGRGNSQSTDGNDCPLGRNTERMNAYLENQPNTRTITSHSPWPVTFQFYTEAKDSDPGLSNDDDIDDIIINKALEVNTGYTEMETFTGNLNRVSFQARFRVMCQQDYYGADCSTFCVAQNDNVNGYYTCNRRDGSFQCLEGFENPNNNCLDMINPCDSSPCTNNGSCTAMEPPKSRVDFVCQCVAGYTGPRCEVNIDHCQSAVCPSNSMCVEGVNSYQCICNPNFIQNGNSCVPLPVTQKETQGAGSFTTSGASQGGSELSGKRNATSTLLAIIVPLSVILLIIIVITVVVIVVIIKWRGKKTHSSKEHQGKWMDNLSAKMIDNPTYGKLSESIATNVIYETPKSPSHDATVHIVDNPIYGEDANYAPVNDEIIRDLQNPIYGDNVDSNTH